MKRVTIDDIAAEMGISKTQVSRALRDTYGVSEETRAKIIVKAYEMGYDMSNIRRKKKIAKRVGCVIPQSSLGDEFFYLKLIYNLERIMTGLHIEFKLIILEPDTDERSLLRQIRDEEITMIITVGMVPDAIILALSETDCPITAVDARGEGLHINRLCFNNYAGTYQITRYIISNGHKNIFFAGDPELTYNFRERYRGYTECMDSFGYKTGCVLFSISGAAQGDALDGLFGKGSSPTAFVCANDRIAFSLCDLLSKRGLSVPEDVSVVGFDNVDRCEWNTPPLTSIDFNPRIVADAAATLLMDRVNNPASPTKCVTLDSNIIIRQSVMPK